MPAHLRILDTDGSVDAASLAGAAPWTTATTVDLRDLGPALRRWSRQRNIELARARIAAASDLRPSLTFLGSRDFHHLAALLIERVGEPFSVLHFDSHADWIRLAPRWHCSSWVNRVLTLPNVVRVVTVGVCGKDLDDPGRKGANLPALGSGRLVLFPWQHASSRARRRLANGPGHAWHEGYLHWRNLAERQLEDTVAMVLDAVPTETVWITVDEDVLAAHGASTRPQPGQMPLAALLQMLAVTGRSKRILGMDVCGEYSLARRHNGLKRLQVRLGPPARNATDERRIEDNRQTDRTLARAFYAAAQAEKS